jgi:hypothetical protein
VEHDVAAVDHLGDERPVRHRVDRVLEAAPPFQVRNVVDRPGREVVQDENVVPLGQQVLGEMRADKAGASGNERFHAKVRPFSNSTTASATRARSASRRRG